MYVIINETFENGKFLNALLKIKMHKQKKQNCKQWYKNAVGYEFICGEHHFDWPWLNSNSDSSENAFK